MSSLEEEMRKLSPEYELAEYLLQCREGSLFKLTPKSKFKININDHPSLSVLLKEKKLEFRTIVRKVIIKAFSDYKFDKNRIEIINKVKDIFSDIELEIRIPKSDNIEDIRAEKHEGRIITFPCEILAVAEPETITTKFLFKCSDCGDEQTYPPNSGHHECGRCHGNMRNEGVAQSATVRTVTVQGINSADNNPIIFTTDMHKELSGMIQMNQKIMLTGIFRSIPPTSRTKHKNEILIDVINLNTLEEDRTTKPDPLTLQMYKDLAKNGKLIDRFVASYAWHIEGYNDLKLACLLYLAKGVEEENYRGRIHIFFLGDPSTAKSQIAKWMVRITPKSTIVDGTASSGVGLGLGMITLPNGRTGMVAGPLLKYNFVFIDEIDKMDKEKYEMLLGVMDDGRCRRTLAGVDIDLPSPCSIIVCGNPIGGQWDLDNPSVGANIKLSVPLLSRADLLFRSLQKPNEEDDKRIGQHIIKSRRERPKDIFSEEEMTSYFNYIRDLKPTMPPESEQKILNFFSQREKFQLGRDSIPMDWRQYEALIRISFAFAKLLLKHTVDEECVQRAINIFKSSVASFGITLEEGGSTAEASKWYTSPKDSKEKAFRILLMKLKEIKGMVFRDELADELAKVKQWKSVDEAQSYITLMHTKDIILEQPNGELKLID